MQMPDHVEDLHLIAEHHTACRALRRIGWGSIAGGIFIIGLGIFFTFYLDLINAVLSLIGLFLLASGIWCLALPGAEGVIANGIALMLIGIWNIVVTVLNLVIGGIPSIWAAVLGVVFIGAAVRSFQKYARFSAALRHGASEDELAMMDRLVKTVLKANSKEDEDIIGFQVRGGFAQQQRQWRGLLCRKWAAFVDKASKEVLIAPKDEVSIEPHGKVLLGQTLKAMVRIRDQKWEALVSPTSFDRFRDWKFGEGEDYPEDEVSADQREPETGIQPAADQTVEPPTGIKRRPPRREEEA
jgi:hypothetical protein